MTALETGTTTNGTEVEDVFRNSTYESERAFFRGLPHVGEGIGPAHIESIVDMADKLKQEIDELRRFVVAISDGNGVRDHRLDAIREGNQVRDRALVELRNIVLNLKQSPEVNGGTKTTPTVRVRMQHTHTMKEGWRLAETTVEYSGESADWEVISAEMKMAFTMGSLEAVDRQKLGTATS